MVYLIILISVCIFAVIVSFRMYRRTGLKCHLFIFLGGAIAQIGAVGTVVYDYIGNAIISNLFDYIFLIPGGILIIIGIIFFITIESGAAQESYRGHSFFEIISGDVTSLKPDKKYKPALSHTFGMLLGFMMTIGGIAQYIDESVIPFSGSYFILFGPALFVVSFIFLNRNKE